MEPVALVVEKFKGLAKSTQDVANGILQWQHSSNRRNPIEILRRLQREAFSDLMKIRDRQDKVERALSFYKISKGNPYQEASTRVRGEVEVLCALLMLDDVDQQRHDAIRRAGIRTGVDSRLIFETIIQEKDSLMAEFVAREMGQANGLGSPLLLSKVHYEANISDWFSVVAVPMGARCRDVGIKKSCSYQEKGLTDYSFSGPPLLNEHSGSAFGLKVKKSNVVASLAQSVSGSNGLRRCFSTFGQVMCQLSASTKLSLLGVYRVPKMSNQQVSLGPMTIPIGLLKREKHSETFEETSSPSIETNWDRNSLSGSIALALESDLDESTRIGGWVEMEKSNPRYLQWAVTMSDLPDDGLGWGLSLGGLVQGPKSWDRFQAEAFLKINLGNRFSLQPGFVSVMDGTTHFPALMLRSSWSL